MESIKVDFRSLKYILCSKM